MKSTPYRDIHRIKYDGGKTKRCRTRETRALLGSRFKILLADAGLSPDAAAQILHVTPRTVRYWISGRVMVPYAAYRLIRITRLFELPCVGWEGWHMHSGRLWSPEGHSFTPQDSSWWNSLVRRARLFHQLYERERVLDMAIRRMTGGDGAAATPGHALAGAGGDAAPSPSGEAGRAAKPASLNLSLKHFRTHI